MRNFLFQREREREKKTKLVNFVPSNLSLSSKLWIFIIGIFIIGRDKCCVIILFPFKRHPPID